MLDLVARKARRVERVPRPLIDEALRLMALHPIAEGPLLLGGTLVSAWVIVRICEPVKPLWRWLGLPAV